MSSRIARLRKKPDRDLVRRLEQLIRAVSDRLDEGQECDALVREINELSGRDHAADDFFELEGWTSVEEAAEMAARGLPAKLDDLSREEVLEILEIVEEAASDCDWFLDLLDRAFPDAEASTIIYYPHRELSREEMADEMLLRRELRRSGGAAAVRARLVALARGVRDDPDAAPWSVQWADGVLDSEDGKG